MDANRSRAMLTHQILRDQRAEVVIVERVDRVQLMRGPEPVEEVEERHPRLERAGERIRRRLEKTQSRRDGDLGARLRDRALNDRRGHDLVVEHALAEDLPLARVVGEPNEAEATVGPAAQQLACIGAPQPLPNTRLERSTAGRACVPLGGHGFGEESAAIIGLTLGSVKEKTVNSRLDSLPDGGVTEVTVLTIEWRPINLIMRPAILPAPESTL